MQTLRLDATGLSREQRTALSNLLQEHSESLYERLESSVENPVSYADFNDEINLVRSMVQANESVVLETRRQVMALRAVVKKQGLLREDPLADGLYEHARTTYIDAWSDAVGKTLYESTDNLEDWLNTTDANDNSVVKNITVSGPLRDDERTDEPWMNVQGSMDDFTVMVEPTEHLVGTTNSGVAKSDCRIEFILTDSYGYDGIRVDEPGGGVNPKLTVTADGNTVVATITPKNYTDEVWTTDPDELENRVQTIVNQFEGTLGKLRSYVADNYDLPEIQHDDETEPGLSR